MASFDVYSKFRNFLDMSNKYMIIYPYVTGASKVSRDHRAAGRSAASDRSGRKFQAVSYVLGPEP